MIHSNLIKTSVSVASSVIIALAIFGMRSAQATVLTFDDLNGIGGGITIPNGYNGLNWDAVVVINPGVNYYENGNLVTFKGSGVINGIVSPPNVAIAGFGLTNVGIPAIVSVPNGSFNFNSVYLTAAYDNDLNILVQGSLNGVTKYSETVIVNDASPTDFNFNYLDIDTLTFTSSGGVPSYSSTGSPLFVLDNFTYNEPVPEPKTILGILVGGSFLLGLSRKYKNLKAISQP